MREVSSRVTAFVVDGIEHHGLDLRTCVEGTSLTRAMLVDPRQRIDWEPFVQMLAQIARLFGGPTRLDHLVVPRAGDRTGHPFVRLARTFLGPPELYRLLARWGLARDMTVLKASFDELGDRRARFTVTVDPTRVGSPELFYMLVGIMRHMPGLVGLPEATVVLTATSHRAVYDLVMPHNASIMQRARRAVTVIAGASATIDALEAQADEIRAKNEQLEAQLTEQRRIEAALREREGFLELALDAGRLGIWSWDIGADRIKWSAGLTRLYGLPDDGAPSRLEEYLVRVHPDDRPQLERDVSDAVSQRATFESEHRIVTPAGSITWIRVKGRVVETGKGGPQTLTGTCADVSERKRLETQLLFADRLTSVGKLAAGVAHELNNPLAYVATNVALMKKRIESAVLASSDTLALGEALDALTDGTQRMREIMGDLRTFSRAELQTRAVVELRPILESSMRLVSNEIRHRAELVTEFGDDLPGVLANESRLGQVFINLLVNAAHAIPDSAGARGLIRVRTYRDAEGHAVTSVEDNGAGIGPEVMRRLFEPFFTTKDIGEGTGLGLAVCESIVAAAGGTIEVESELGRGSTFRVVLPAAKGPTTVPGTETSLESSGGRILVIDDEPLLRKSLAILLHAHGFDVTLAETSREGLARALDAPSFDVILCDLMMPGMTGMDLHEELERTQPEIARRVLFLTGGAFTPRASRFLGHIANAYVDKPFELKHLLDAIELTKRKTR